MSRDGQKDDRAGSRMPRRATDLAEDVAAWVLVALMLLTGAVALLVGVGTFGRTAEEVRAEEGTQTLVNATLLESVPLLALEQPPSDVPASWTGPDGQPRMGVVQVVSGMAGEQVPIWVNRVGERVPPPRTPTDAATAGFASAIAVLMAGAIVLGAAWLLVSRVTHVVNARRWEQEWDDFGPRWTEQR